MVGLCLRATTLRTMQRDPRVLKIQTSEKLNHVHPCPQPQRCLLSIRPTCHLSKHWRPGTSTAELEVLALALHPRKGLYQGYRTPKLYNPNGPTSLQSHHAAIPRRPMYMHIYIYVFTHIYTYIHMNIYLCTYDVNTSVRIRVCVCAHIYIYLCISTFYSCILYSTCAYMYMYTPTYTLNIHGSYPQQASPRLHPPPLSARRPSSPAACDGGSPCRRDQYLRLGLPCIPWIKVKSPSAHTLGTLAGLSEGLFENSGCGGHRCYGICRV